MNTMTEVASELDWFVESNGTGYDVPKAQLFSIAKTEDGLKFVKANENGDVYDLLTSRKSVTVAKKAYAIGVLTVGWAAPVEDDDHSDLAPSEHPKRRRVRLICVASREDVASVLRFQDDNDNPITDDGQAVGSLANAIRELVSA